MKNNFVISIILSGLLFHGSSFSLDVTISTRQISEQEQQKQKKITKKIAIVVGAVVLGLSGYAGYHYVRKQWKKYWEERQREIDARHRQLQEQYKLEQQKEFQQALNQNDFKTLQNLISQGVLPPEEAFSEQENVLHKLIGIWKPTIHSDIWDTVHHLLYIHKNEKLKRNAKNSENKSPFALVIKKMAEYPSEDSKLFNLMDLLVDQGADYKEALPEAFLIYGANIQAGRALWGARPS